MEVSVERIWSTELAAHVGERVRLAGWLHHQRRLSQVSFLLVRDRDGIAQVVVTAERCRDYVGDVPAESVLEVTGTVVTSTQAPAGVELHDPEVVVIARAEA